MINKICKCLLIFALTINMNKINAQEKNMANADLSAQQKSLVIISALTAAGNITSLKQELNNGLDADLTVNEIKEALVQLYAYCGFPRSLNAIDAFKTVLDARKATGITDKLGKEFVVENKVSDKYEQGRKVLEELTKTAQAKPAPGFGEFAPRIDGFLKEHLFADIFVSDVLNYQQRELVTIAALATITGVEAQLQSHINIGKNTGLNHSKLENVAILIEKHINRTQANIIRKILGTTVLPIIKPDMIVRISEIEINAKDLASYQAILAEEAKKSVEIELGVIAIFPMFQKENETQFRIIEIYANQEAYQSHLKTPHFQYYKTNTQNMVKSLKLVDMQTIDKETMLLIFNKLN